MFMASSIIQQQQRPPAYMLQSWHREQPNSYDNKYFLQQRFIIAPDGSIPFSRLRQCIRNIYEERNQVLVVVHYDPWEKKSQIQKIITSTQDLVKSHTTL